MQGAVSEDYPKLQARHDAKMNRMRLVGGCDPFATPFFGATRDDPLSTVAARADSKIFSRSWSAEPGFDNRRFDGVHVRIGSKCELLAVSRTEDPKDAIEHPHREATHDWRDRQ
jgi:hypothetical protein